ncbi:hypothetical protein SAMCFNEI73_pB0202 (plasmid) [Sinorhizobium americanum]|uniref:Uncharacterized protein n=1 Tax=Sinorhizobium americanum TaxID=194963 RepID=A0A1L3LTK4_9HYPH|nr:hypothetical protein SAMCFNEI73_pB0202 [Sinorhizobium americanum]
MYLMSQASSGQRSTRWLRAAVPLPRDARPGGDPERIAYARTPRKLPAILSADEVVRF